MSESDAPISPLPSNHTSKPCVTGIHPPPPLCFDHNIAEKWKIFRQKWQLYATLVFLKDQPQEYQVALLLHSLGDDALRIYNSFTFDTTEEHRTVDQILGKFDDYAIGEVNETYERYIFHRRSQLDGETFEAFLSTLKNLIKTCNFCSTCADGILKDRIVLGIKDSSVQAALLRERKLTLDKCIDLCRASEHAHQHHQAMTAETVHKLHSSQLQYRKKKPNSRNPVSAPTSRYKSSQKKECKFCTFAHPFRKEECPAYGKTCKKCGLRNHFAEKCPSTARKVHCVNTQESDSEPGEWINTVNKANSKDIKCVMMVNGQRVTFLVDTGATVNLLPARYANKITPSKTTLKMWNQTEAPNLGTCKMSLTNPLTKQTVVTDFIVCPDSYTAILGKQTSEKMDLIFINNNFERVAAVSPDNIVSKHPSVFDGNLGTIPGVHRLKTDPTVRPIVMANRRVPIAVKARLKNELDRLTNLGVITPVNTPTPWVSQMVVAEKKSGDLRICIDPRELNKALVRERYTLPTLDDCLHELGKSTIFSKADLASGYWHISLDEESSLLTTFQTPFGRYRWLRLPFGTSVSSEIFQRKLLEALHGLPGVVCVADDVLIHGRTTEEHDHNLEKFLERCETTGIKLNQTKLELRMQNVTFMGHIISKDGLATDPEKVRAITEFPRPETLEQLRRFIGMVNYLARYVPRLADIVQPLTNLLKIDVLWQWSSAQEEAFSKIKEAIAAAPTLQYYDPSKELTLENDASDYGIGTALLQEGKPVAFASRSLSASERNYAQIEKEMLAVVFGLEKFHQYTYGRQLMIVTDHKPLVSISKKPLSKAPKRLQALLLRTQVYTFDLIYRPGKDLVLSDTLSRAPLKDILPGEKVIVNMVSNLQDTPFNTDRLQCIRTATAADKTLSALADVLRTGWPDNKRDLPTALLPYFSYRDELTTQDGIVLRGDRVTIPSSMRPEMIEKVHAGHLGINSCLRRARDLIFWPGMSKEIRQYVESCDTCASNMCQQSPEPILLHDIPSLPWKKIGTDLFAIEGRNYLVTSDYFSNFIEVDYLPETSASTVISKLKHHFARHGIPDTVISDCGSQFTSDTFAKFSKDWNFRHIKSSPGHHNANGEAESAVKIVKRIFTKCRANKEDPYLGLLNHRNTPTEGLNTSPAQRLFARRTDSHLPCIQSKLKHITMNDDSAAAKKSARRKNAVDNINQRRRELPPLNVGDPVRMQPFDTTKQWRSATVTRRLAKRTYEVTTGSGKYYRRNRVHLRPSKIRTPSPEYISLPSDNAQADTSTSSNDYNPASSLPRHHPQTTMSTPLTPVRKDPPTRTPSAETSTLQSRIPIYKRPVLLRSGRLTKPPSRFAQ